MTYKKMNEYKIENNELMDWYVDESSWDCVTKFYKITTFLPF